MPAVSSKCRQYPVIATILRHILAQMAKLAASAGDCRHLTETASIYQSLPQFAGGEWRLTGLIICAGICLRMAATAWDCRGLLELWTLRDRYRNIVLQTRVDMYSKSEKLTILIVLLFIWRREMKKKFPLFIYIEPAVGTLQWNQVRTMVHYQFGQNMTK